MEVQGSMLCSIVSSYFTSTVIKNEDQGQASNNCLCWQCRGYLHDQNITTTRHSKHLDIYYKFVTEYIEDGIIKVIFVKSADNDSDYVTKNLGLELHSHQAGKVISMKEILWKMNFSIEVLALGETPTYQMKEHCMLTLNWLRQKGRVSKVHFWRWFLSRSFKFGGIIILKCWISLMTDDCRNLWKSE